MQSPAVESPESIRALERGNILLFRETPFSIPADDRRTLLATGQAGGHLHKNISYRPLKDQVTGVDTPEAGERENVRRALRNYSHAAIGLLERVLAPYRSRWRTDYASYRSIEEEGRDLPWKKRNDLLHTDAFPTRPTRGDLILRIFTNVNPDKDRVWMTSDPFAQVAARYASSAGLTRIAAHSFSPLRALGRAFGLPNRSRYDEFMLGFHDFLKGSAEYQSNCVKYRFAFPPGSTWIVFTDIVPHAVLSGRCALEQTMIIARDSLLQPECAPVSILERLSGARLT